MSDSINIQGPKIWPRVWNVGWVEVVCGSMFSGKTEELIRRIKRAQIAKQKIQLFKPRMDTRFSPDHVTSHSALSLDSENITDPEEILQKLDDNTRVVGVDEAQFLSMSIIEISQRLANRGLRVIIAGLDLDYRGVPFGPIPHLMATAEFVTKMSAICTRCGNTASRTQRIENLDSESGANGSTSPVELGAQELYEARCRQCFEPPA
jgi:thymidine kinase